MSTDAIAHIMSEIMFSIPREVLEAAFVPSMYGTTIDNRIIENILKARILLDANLVSGKAVNIPLQEEWKIYLDNPYGLYTGMSTDATVYQVPPEAREGRPIISVDRVVFSSLLISQGATLPQINQGWGNTISNMASAVVNSRTFAQVPAMPIPYLLASNMVRVTPTTWSDNLVLQCHIAFDERFTNIHPGQIEPLRQMALAATKMWIWKELVIKIDANEMVNGMPMGRLKEIVDSYSDQAEVYREYRDRFFASKLMDPDTAMKLAMYML